ncbi:MAG: extracellular solute-binding protein, partial [Pseudomonadota bacterium]
MPLSLSAGVLMYRKDLFAEAGLDPERPPEDWAELLEYARRLTVPSRNQHGLMVYGGQYLSWGSYALLVSNGGRAMQRNAEGVWSASFDSPEMAEAAAFLWRLAREPFAADHDGGRASPGAAIVGPGTGAELDRMWQRGQVGMTFQSFREDLVALANPELIGVAPVPKAPRGRRGAEVNARMLGVFSGSTHAQKLAVMRFIWFMTSEEAQRIRTRIYVENGFGRFANPLWLERYGYEEALAQVPPAIRQLYATIFDDGVPEPYGRNTQHIYRYMSEPLLAALESDLGGLSPPERAAYILPLLRDAADKTNAKLLGKLTDDEVTRRLW